MRPIMISTDVLAALWTRRKPGEESENDILARLLGLPRQPPVPDAALIVRERGPRPPHADGGIFNTNFRVKFPQGFEIFRTYKGKQHKGGILGDYANLFISVDADIAGTIGNLTGVQLPLPLPKGKGTTAPTAPLQSPTTPKIPDGVKGLTDRIRNQEQSDLELLLFGGLS